MNSVVYQRGSAVLLAAVSIIVLGTGLVLAQLAATKSDTTTTTATQVTATAAQQGAAFAAAAGVSVVNNLSSSGTCASSSGCSGIYGIGVLSGGAANQSSTWWSNSSNVRTYSYPGLKTPVAYVIEQLSCNSTSGLTNYRITARAVSNSSSTTLQGENIVWYYATATKTWAPTTTTVTLYDYSCNASSLGFSNRTPSFVVGAAGNLSAYNANQPYPAFSSSIASGTGYITQIEPGIGSWSQSTNLQITVTVAGSQVYTGTLSSGPMSNRGYSLCSSGNNMSVFVLPSPIPVSMGQSVSIAFSSCSVSGCVLHYGTTGQSPGNNSSTQMRYRVIGTQSVNNCPVAS
jgi:hypothetical protein